jgi:hypothetical protein
LLYNWLATKTTVKERFAFMFNNEILEDVHFKVIFIITLQTGTRFSYFPSMGTAQSLEYPF